VVKEPDCFLGRRGEAAEGALADSDLRARLGQLFRCELEHIKTSKGARDLGESRVKKKAAGSPGCTGIEEIWRRTCGAPVRKSASLGASLAQEKEGKWREGPGLDVSKDQLGNPKRKV
jgi:hypothetical protein